MTPPVKRRPTLRDVMILVAATAVGMAWAQGGWDWMYISRLQTNGALNPRWQSTDRVVRALPSALPCLATWSIALLGLRLCPPRPRLRRVALQPGAAACIAATLGLVVGAVDFALSALWWGLLKDAYMTWDIVPSHSIDYLFHSSARIAIGVASVWTILALSRVCRPEASWIDRLGRVLGVLWILLALCRGWGEVAQVIANNGPPGAVKLYYDPLFHPLNAPLYQ